MTFEIFPISKRVAKLGVIQLRRIAGVGRLSDYRPWRLLRRSRRSAFSRLEGRIGVALLCPNLDAPTARRRRPPSDFRRRENSYMPADASMRIQLCRASFSCRSVSNLRGTRVEAISKWSSSKISDIENCLIQEMQFQSGYLEISGYRT